MTRGGGRGRSIQASNLIPYGLLGQIERVNGGGEVIFGTNLPRPRTTCAIKALDVLEGIGREVENVPRGFSAKKVAVPLPRFC